jgi:hypothetical protein
VLILLRALGAARQNIRYTAQTGSDARKKWMDDWLPALDASSFARFYRPRLTNGHEALRFTNGSLQGLVATTQKSGHGGTLDLGILDEAFAHPDARLEQALKPAMITRPQPQLWVVSTAGTPDQSPYLWARCRGPPDGRRGPDGLRSPTSSGRASDDVDPADPATWWSCMPALGHTVTEEAVASDFASMELGEFERAYLNRWHAPANEPVVPLAVWAALVDAASTPARSGVSRVRCEPRWAQRGDRRRWLSRGRASARRGRRPPRRDGWLEDRIVGLEAKHYPSVIVCDGRGPAASFVEKLSNRGVRVETLNAQEHAQACARSWMRRRRRRSGTAGSP